MEAYYNTYIYSWPVQYSSYALHSTESSFVGSCVYIHSFLLDINASGLHASMKLIDYARSPLHCRTDIACSFCCNGPLKGKSMDAFSSERDLAHFLSVQILSAIDHRCLPILFLSSILIFDIQYIAAELLSFHCNSIIESISY